MSRFARRVLVAAAVGALALTTAGTAAAGAAAGAPWSMGPPSYSSAWAGYQAGGGRWFRYVSTTVTVPPRVVPSSDGSDATVWLSGIGSVVPAQIYAAPGGGAGSVGWNGGQFTVSPRVGDRLQLSIYYDQRSHDYLTVTDLTRHVTQTVRMTVPKMTYLHARVFVFVNSTVSPPSADTPLWRFTGSRLTTYSGVHGTLAGPWTTSKIIVTTTSTPSGTVIASPSALSNGGRDFTAWSRALPLSYTSAYAGYQVGGGRSFRYVATRLTMPPSPQPAGNAATAAIALVHNGVASPQPYARIEVSPFGGPGSISYWTSASKGIFNLSPQPGDQVAISIYYDQHGRDYLSAADLSRGTSQTISRPASLVIASMPYNSAWIAAMIGNDTVTPPQADTRIWAFADSRITTYSGDHGTILGPWATSELTDTTTGTAAGRTVMNAPVLGNGARDFGVWLRHR